MASVLPNKVVGIMVMITILLCSPLVTAQLSVSYYANTCPSVFDTVRAGVRSAVNREARMGASLIRLFFHDCFVNGCDGGILLADTDSFVGEQNANPNRDSARGYNVIDTIKSSVDGACGAGIVSCADILAIAARDSTVELGGQSYSVPLGRRDARTASRDGANSDLPGFSETLDQITDKFERKGFTQREMVALSGAHTVGQAQCRTFRDRIYNDTNIDAAFAASRQANCPRTGGDTNLAPLDAQSPNRFGNNYFQALINQRGLLNSDQVLYNGGPTDSIVTTYSNSPSTFSTDYGNAMVKMGNMSPLTGTQGEIRNVCSRVN